MGKIEIEKLSFAYGARNKEQKNKVFDEISLEINDNQSVGIIGENGVGKSTFLKLLVGLLPSYEGKIVINGLHVKKENLVEIRKRVGYVFQDSDSQLFMNTVYEDVAFAPKNYGLSAEEVERRVAIALSKTKIEDLRDRHIYKLSGGQKKLVAIATILSIGADMLLMDEPSVALDPANRENLINILNELSGIKVIASHDLDFIYDTCKRTILLSEGRIVYDGDTKEIMRNKKLLEENGLKLPLSFRFMEDR